MRTTIDSAGRVVIPKAMRERLGLNGGQEVEVTEGGGRIEIEAVPTPMTLKADADSGLVAVPDTELPALTDDMVRSTLEQTRR